jgi:protein-disulfide isomerase
MGGRTMKFLVFAAFAGALALPAFAADPPPVSDQQVAAKAAALYHDPESQVLGNPKGDVTMVEFFDYACPICKAVEPKIEALLASDKNLKLVIKEFPILTPESLTASKVALAAAKQGKYGQFHQALMLYRGPLTEAAIFDVAAKTGLNMTRLKRDMTSPAITTEIYNNLNLARGLRAFTTPIFVVNNHILPNDNSRALDFAQAVADARARPITN